MLHRSVNNSQRFKAEEVEFYEPCALDPLHVELRSGKVTARVAVEGRELGQGPV